MKYIIIVLWLILGWLYWTMTKNCCDSDSGEISLIDNTPVINAADEAATFPIIRFDSAGTDVNLGSGWGKVRDSILTAVGDDRLEIEGRYFEAEVQGGADELGRQRARAVRSEFESLDDSKITISASSIPGSYDPGLSGNLVTFNIIPDNEHIAELEDRVMIYFPFNSTGALTDPELVKYLDGIAERVATSGERVVLTGHTDNIGSAAANLRVGELRARVIENYLVRAGINPSRILVVSRGENSPVESNDDAAGRAKNRRVELQITK